MSNLTLEEMETNINMVAANRSVWEVSSDDPVMQRKLEKANAKLIKEKDGCKFYQMDAAQITFRKGKRQLSTAQKERLSERMKQLHANKG